MRWTLLVLGLAACSEDRHVEIRASVCGALCGDTTRSATDFTGLDCASAARVRVFHRGDDAGETIASDTCVRLDATTSLASLFTVDSDGGATAGSALSLKSFPTSGNVSVEVALFAPGVASGCPDGVPLVALGRSAEVDLSAGLPSTFDVPLGCHALCAGDIARTWALTLHAIEAVDTTVALPSTPQIGELFDYTPLESTGGVCEAASPDASPTQFAPFVTTSTGGTLTGDFALASTADAGCLALHVPGTPDVYACVNLDDPANPLAYVPTTLKGLVAQHVQASDTRGAVVVLTQAFYHQGISAVHIAGPTGATVYYVSFDLSSASSTDTATSTVGLAIIPDAPLGLYTMTASGQPDVTFSVGGAEPGSIVTIGPAFPQH